MKLAGAVLCGGLVLVACSSSSNDPGPLTGQSGSKAVVLHAGSTYVTSDLSNAADVRDDRIVFPANASAVLSTHAAGDILLGDRGGATNPDGFLRKVVSIATGADGVTVMTSTALLQEAMDTFQVDTTLQTPELGIDGPAAQSKGGLKIQGGTTVKLVDFSGKKLFSINDTAVTSDNRTIPYTAAATVETGTLSFSPTWNLKADVGFLKLKSFDVKATGKLDAALLVDVSVTIDPSVDAKTRTDLAGKLLTKSYTATVADYNVSLGSPRIGIINLPSSAHFTTTVQCSFAFTTPVEAKMGGTASGSVTVDLAYDGTNLTPTVSDPGATFTPTTPTFTQNGLLRGTCTVTPHFQLKLFGVATGELTAEADLGVGAAETCVPTASRMLSGDLVAGMSAKVLAKVDVFGLYKWQKECQLFDVSTTQHWDTTYADPANGGTCTAAPDSTLPPRPATNLASCFSDGASASTDGGADSATTINGTCTHDTCTAGDKLGQQCDDCTQKVCAADSYCCDTYWGLSCLDEVTALCGKTCN